MENFKHKSMYHIYVYMQKLLKNINTHDILEFEVLNPDMLTSKYSGTIIEFYDETYIYHSYRSWMDLANSLHCKMLTPKIHKKNTVILRFEKLNPDVSFHASQVEKEEKYGSESIFSLINKNEEASFIIPFAQALKNVQIDTRKRILNLGVNNADEFEAIQNISENFSDIEFIGIDYCKSAIDIAKQKFSDVKNVHFYQCDIKEIDKLDIGKFDLIISIGTLQSSNLDFNPIFMDIVQKYLKKEGAMILGFPNCRWIDGEMIYGAKVKNYNFSEMSLVYKDVMFCKKYLQQKKFRVTVTGKDYIFVTATSIRKEK